MAVSIVQDHTIPLNVEAFRIANLNLLNKRPKETVTKRIDTMLGSSTTTVEIYSATLNSLNRSFDMNIELSKVHKPQLLNLDDSN